MMLRNDPLAKLAFALALLRMRSRRAIPRLRDHSARTGFELEANPVEPYPARNTIFELSDTRHRCAAKVVFNRRWSKEIFAASTTLLKCGSL